MNRAWICLAFILTGCGMDDQPEVVVYTSQDQVYSQKILTAFSRETGIRAQALYDSEAVKTVGLANRLLAEKNHPQCDLFWSNEEMLTRRLKSMGVFREEDPIVEVGYRTRRIVVNTNLVASGQYPTSVAELSLPRWKGKVAIAYPMFGTTATHFMALRAHWGDAKWNEWNRSLVKNETQFVDGNSVVVKQVAAGEAWIGLTDSDDIAAGQRNGYPIQALPLNPELAVIPNTIGIVRGAPNPKTAEILRDYIRLKGAKMLVDENALEGMNPEEVRSQTLDIPWPEVLEKFDDSIHRMKQIFLR